MSNFLKSILKDSGNEHASLASDGLEADISGFVDTGSYSFNALLSGTIHGGMPDNKILGIAGESAWLESHVSELVDQVTEWHAVLKRHADGGREAVDEAAHGGALLRHLQEDLAWLAALATAWTVPAVIRTGLPPKNEAPAPAAPSS